MEKVQTTTFITQSSAQTQLIAEEFAKKLVGGDIILLKGDLGAGKTTFVQGLANGLGIKRRIISPTFIVMRSYELQENMFYHIDLYRMTSQQDIEGLGLLQLFEDKHAILAIEWPEKLGNLIPKKYTEISCTWISENSRKIEIKKYE
ncbi:MAG TPA: tRNA (adenosine(37)-N6)-threonylcarbamoyltransferase complex ATPase subunit type 1 TsaE [Patescibacteria group bacterium]|nr:tRNA (adenosine(37)-N6)-threonylcarbamoyltransferase complex ATPase subunit type 1 TsaE [Patescibacteria group bacterium]